MNSLFYLTPFILQGFLIFIDEFYSHNKRGLSLWEQTSHLLDTISLLAPMGLAMFAHPTEFARSLFIVLSVISCLSITKDEWIHAEKSDGLESWLHSVLFILHPLTLVATFLAWSSEPPILALLKIPFFLILLFGSYQATRLIYGFVQRRKRSSFS